MLSHPMDVLKVAFHCSRLCHSGKLTVLPKIARFKLYLAQPPVANPFNCSCLVINPTRYERFIVSVTIAIKELTILIRC